MMHSHKPETSHPGNDKLLTDQKHLFTDFLFTLVALQCNFVA